ncbi:LLM class flavin-dependent oxidoreductase, partial [bacterium]|nr:LLM class flavin-dependent oxidoreductase [bacterium]
RLLQGQEFHHCGQHYRLEKTRLYTLPAAPPPIAVATSGPYMSKKIGELGLSLLTVKAERDKMQGLLERFAQGLNTCGSASEQAKRWLQMHVSWADDYGTACENALREWPNGAMNFPKADIRYPQVLADIARSVRIEDFASRVLIATDAEDYRRALQEAEGLGFDTVFIHNVGRNQAEFMRFAASESLLEQ